MLHIRRTQDSFNFLVSSLVSIEEEFSNVLAIGSNRDAALAMWLSHKKHMEDDVTQKLNDLHGRDLEKKEFLLDIFGSDEQKEMGLNRCIQFSRV